MVVVLKYNELLTDNKLLSLKGIKQLWWRAEKQACWPMGILASSKHQYTQNACKQSPNLEWRVLSWWMLLVVLEEAAPLIPNGGFGSSLGPPAIVSSCWTGLPPVGFSSPWSRGTTGGPSTASSWHPGTREGTTEWERLRSKWQKKRETGRGKTTVVKRGWNEEAGENRERHGEAWHRQAEWQTLINTSLWLLFTWARACFRCYCISPANTAGDVCCRNITDEIWTRAEICRHFLQYQSTLNIITVVVTLWAWL